MRYIGKKPDNDNYYEFLLQIDCKLIIVSYL